MSIEALNWAFKLNLPPNKKIIMLALADHADERHRCFPSFAKLCQKCSVSKSTIIRQLDELENAGFISIEDRFRPDGSQTSNWYQLKMGGSVKMTPPGVNSDTPITTNCNKEIEDKPQKRKTAIPDDFEPTPETIKVCIERRPDVNIDAFTIQFKEAATAGGYRYIDWQSAYRNWIMNAKGSNNVRFIGRKEKPTLDEIGDAFADAARIAAGNDTA